MQLHKIKNEREGIVLLFYLSKKELSKVRYLIKTFTDRRTKV